MHKSKVWLLWMSIKFNSIVIKLYFFDMTHLDVNMYLKFKVCKYFDSTSMEMLLQVICL